MKGRALTLEHLFAEAVLKLGIERLVAQDQARVEQRGANGHVRVAETHALVDVARGMADLEAQIPQQIEHVLGDALAPGGLLVGKQEQKIDVGAGREKTAPVAALRHDGHALGRRGVVGGIDVGGGEVVSELDQSVLEGREALGAGSAVAILFKLTFGGRPRLLDQTAEALDQRHAERGILPGIGAGKLRGLVTQEVEIEIGRLSRGGLVHGGRLRSLAHEGLTPR